MQDAVYLNARGVSFAFLTVGVWDEVAYGLDDQWAQAVASCGSRHPCSRPPFRISKPQLAAIVEPLRSVAAERGEAEDRYRFGVETMEEQGLRVLTVNDLGRIAETARRELRV